MGEWPDQLHPGLQIRTIYRRRRRVRPGAGRRQFRDHTLSRIRYAPPQCCERYGGTSHRPEICMNIHHDVMHEIFYKPALGFTARFGFGVMNVVRYCELLVAVDESAIRAAGLFRVTGLGQTH